MNRRHVIIGAGAAVLAPGQVIKADEPERESDAWLVGYYSDSSEGRAAHDAVVKARKESAA